LEFQAVLILGLGEKEKREITSAAGGAGGDEFRAE